MFNRKLMAIVLGGCVGAAAQAGDTHQGYAGVLVGGQTIQTTGTGGQSNTGFALGAEAGALLMDGTVGLGLDFTWQKKNGSTFTFYNLDGNYYWKDVAPGLYTGVKLGFAHNDAATPFDLGVAVGWDYGVASNISVGAEVSYVRVFAKDPSVAMNVYNYGVTGKFWF